jgi:hypothetical protein
MRASFTVRILLFHQLIWKVEVFAHLSFVMKKICVLLLCSGRPQGWLFWNRHTSSTRSRAVASQPTGPLSLQPPNTPAGYGVCLIQLFTIPVETYFFWDLLWLTVGKICNSCKNFCLMGQREVSFNFVEKQEILILLSLFSQWEYSTIAHHNWGKILDTGSMCYLLGY